jgi:UDP-4-amino-4,6-dideoxy-N-acetyl-beta-L-altrosamine transaminase
MADTTFLPYGRQNIVDDDIEAVIQVLRSDWLTQGPAVPAFEDALADTVGATETLACASGTAALHLAILALGLGEGDAVITTPNTFLASANCARFVGADVLFADIQSGTGLIDPESVRQLFTRDTEHKIKAIIPVHFAGQPADLPAIAAMAREHGTRVIDDACHALGARYTYNGNTFRIGGSPHSDMTVFSFHPVKHVATGEGGAVATSNPDLAARLRLFRNHGIERQNTINADMAYDADGVPNPWYYEMQELGFNYRLTDIQAALGLSQLKKLSGSLERRRELAQNYRQLLAETFADGEVTPLEVRPDTFHAYHLFVVQIDFDRLGVSRAAVMNRLRSQGIGTQVHYIPVHLQPYYRRHCGTGPGNCPQAEKYYTLALSLPMYPELAPSDIRRVVRELEEALVGKKQAVGQHYIARR